MPRRPRSLDPIFPLHVTGRVNDRQPFPTRLDVTWEILVDYLFLLNHGYEIDVMSFVLMPNHFHLLCLDPKLNLSKGMAHFMRETSREINLISGHEDQVWGGPYFNSVIKSPLYYLHAYKYIYRNPVRAGICAKVEEYPFSSLSILLGNRWSALPLTYDSTFFEGGVTSCLDWLNTDYSKVENDSIRAALNKSTFKFRKDPCSRQPLKIEDPSSISFLINVLDSAMP